MHIFLNRLLFLVVALSYLQLQPHFTEYFLLHQADHGILLGRHLNIVLHLLEILVAFGLNCCQLFFMSKHKLLHFFLQLGISWRKLRLLFIKFPPEFFQLLLCLQLRFLLESL